MSKLSRLAALLVAGVVITLPAVAADKAKALVTVNGQPIPQAVYDTILAEQIAKGAPNSPEVQANLKEQLIGRELLVQEAKKKGYDKKDAVLLQIEAAKQSILVNAFLADYVRANQVSDEALKAEYEAIKARLGSTEYKPRHVLVDTEDEAKAIIGRLDKGEKFSEVARLSKDQGSRERGGDLGWTSAASFVKPFSEAMVKLNKGEYTHAPVKSEFGYHVIQLEDSRPINPPPFEEVKPQLQQRASQQQVDGLVRELRGKAKIN
jgi:peptidyl-prolyl cis-trans isomerase C